MNKTANMPSLAGLLDVIESWAPSRELKFIDTPPSDPRTLGMDATVSSSVRITGQRVCSPTMGCPMAPGKEFCPDDQSIIDQCPEC